MTTSVYAQCFKHSGLQHLNLVYNLNLWLSQMFIMSQFKDTLFHFQGLGNIWVFIEYCQYIIVNAPLQFCIFFLQPMIKLAQKCCKILKYRKDPTICLCIFFSIVDLIFMWLLQIYSEFFDSPLTKSFLWGNHLK